jgi:CRISPR-associated protein Cas1
MSYRTIFISKPANLSISKNRLAIKQDDEVFTIPLEDISTIIFDSYQINFSGQVLARIADYGVVLVSCDTTHIPNGIFYSYLPHSRQNLVLYKQLNLGAVFKRKIWHQLVLAKLTNQHFVLNVTKSINQLESQKLNSIITKLTSGDKDNREAMVSRFYFPKLFGADFIRKGKFDLKDNDNHIDKLNILLNYTYAILRSIIIRHLVGFGLLPTLGCFHDNQQNSFNLADDFIEPFRPYVDWYVYSYIIEVCSVEISVSCKTRLVDVINHIVNIGGRQQTINNAIEVMVSSYITSINNGDPSCFKTPYFLEIIKRVNLN